MYSTDPDRFYLNIAFVFKIACLLLAIVYHYTLHRRVALAGDLGMKPKFAACLSLVLWVGVVFGGIFIEFVKEGLSLTL